MLVVCILWFFSTEFFFSGGAFTSELTVYFQVGHLFDFLPSDGKDSGNENDSADSSRRGSYSRLHVRKLISVKLVIILF